MGHKNTATNPVTTVGSGQGALALLNLFSSEPPPRHVVAEIETPSNQPLPDTGTTVWPVGAVSAVLADSNSYWRLAKEGRSRIPSGKVIGQTFRVANVFIFAWRPRIAAAIAAVHELRMEARRS